MRHIEYLLTMVVLGMSCSPVPEPRLGTFCGAEFPTGRQATCVAIADLDGDGDSDLVVTNGGDDDVTVLFNNGDAAFGESIALPVGATPPSVVVGDLDGDGLSDIAVANSRLSEAEGSVSVLLNLGDGSFAEAVDYEAEAAPNSLTLGDLDGDDDLDLAVATLYGLGVSILLNQGNGTFEDYVSYPIAGIAPRSVVAGDFDGDGDLDLAGATDGRMQVEARLTILLNNGDGTFASGDDYGNIGVPMALAVGDLNADSDLDVVVASLFGGGVIVMSGRGDGTFSNPRFYAAEEDAGSVALGDFDADGDLDIAFTNPILHYVSILFNRGDATFSGLTKYNAETKPSFVAVSDLNHDGNPDLAVSNQDSDSVTVLVNYLGSSESLDGCSDREIESTTPAVSTEIPEVNEIVMQEGMKITATTSVGTMTVAAGGGLERSYTWEGATRSVIMIPRHERWINGSFGLYFPGPGNHWQEHNGIVRGLLEEGQQHFESTHEALEWIESRRWLTYVYRDDGLTVGWRKDGDKLNVDVWQILVNGETPTELDGSQNDMIVVDYPMNLG